jgi:hypothetical protein
MPTKTPVKPKTEEVDPIEVLEPEMAEYTFTLGENGPDPMTFTQKPLSFMGKMKLFSVLSSTLKKVMENDVSISDLLDAPASDSLPLSGDASDEANTFLKTLLAVAEYAPERMGDVFCVILAVPGGQTEYVKEKFDTELTDEQAFSILNTFVDQNWDVLYDFFTGKGLSLFKKISQKFQK